MHAQLANTQFSVSFEALISGNSGNPFWFYSNREGMIDPGSGNLLGQFGLDHEFFKTEDLSITGSLLGVARASENPVLYLHSGFAEVDYKRVFFKAGRVKDLIGIFDQELSSGSMIMSSNAPPMPGYSFGTNGFQDVPGLDGYLQFKFLYSDKWFENTNREVSGAKLHQKFLYLRPRWRDFYISVGFSHNVMWGGENEIYGDLGNTFQDYLRVVIPSGADSSSEISGEIRNFQGNTLAAYEFQAGWDNGIIGIQATRQFYLEDTPGLEFRSTWDGLWNLGINFYDDSSPIDRFVFEILNTKQQNSFDWEPWGTDNYYSNFIYKSGWSYYGTILGTPLISYDRETKQISNNIITAVHFGASGAIGEIDYTLFYTYSRNYGVSTDQQTTGGDLIPLGELRRDRHSTLIEVQATPFANPNISVFSALGMDWGSFYNSEVILGASAGCKLMF